jgi:outer membrane lipoprotein-sorting protein
MTKNMKTTLITIFLAISSLTIGQQYPSGKTVLDKIDDNMSAKSRITTAKMEINTVRGVRTMESKSWTEGNEKSFTEYLAPAREKGTKMLKLENQLWIFSPATDRVIQISGHMLRQSVMGSDLSYEDMMNDTPLLEQYSANVTGEETIDGRKCWIVTLTAIKPEVNYQMQQMWVDQERYVPLKVDMFAKSKKLLKRIVFSDVQKVQGRWFPMTMLYKDMLKNGKGTKMMFQEIQLDAKIPANIFNKSSLK